MKVVRLIKKIRTNSKINIIILITLIVISIYAFFQVFIGQTFINGLLRFRMFTNISNTSVLVTLILYLLKFGKKKFFKYLSFITLINILMTGIIYNIWLEREHNFNTHVVHTLVPILYTLFYFSMVDNIIPIKKFWIGVVTPVLYFTVMLIQGNFTKWYPYFFFDPTRSGSSMFSVLLLCGGILLPIITVITYLLSFGKNKFECELIYKNRKLRSSLYEKIKVYD